MAVVIPPINDGSNVYPEDISACYQAVIEEAQASVNRALVWPNGSGSRYAESMLANALINLAGEFREIYNGATPLVLGTEPPPVS